jgi:hypothetical protein
MTYQRINPEAAKPASDPLADSASAARAEWLGDAAHLLQRRILRQDRDLASGVRTKLEASFAARIVALRHEGGPVPIAELEAETKRVAAAGEVTDEEVAAMAAKRIGARDALAAELGKAWADTWTTFAAWVTFPGRLPAAADAMVRRGLLRQPPPDLIADRKRANLDQRQSDADSTAEAWLGTRAQAAARYAGVRV